MKKLIFFLITFIPFIGISQSNILPYPNSLEMGNGKLRINADFGIELQGSQNDKILEKNGNYFLKRLNKKTLAYFNQEKVVLNQKNPIAILKIEVKQSAKANIGMNESYSIVIKSDEITLKAENSIGALRGLESLLQLAQSDSLGFYFPVLKINDAPRFAWRGMMIDVARHFIPMDVLMRNIDAMAMVKLNVLHLHLSDDEGFRVESKIYPKLQEFGSNGQFYTQNELKSLVKYAEEKGIMVYPEFDLPGHSTSWFAGYPELSSLPGKFSPGPRFKIPKGASMGDAIKLITNAVTPTIDPTNEETYRFLERFITEMCGIFTSPYFHIGADENNGKAWKENKRIVAFMKAKGMANTNELQAYFVKRMAEILKRHGKTTMGWEELFNAGLSKEVIVQVWGSRDPNVKTPSEIAQHGNKVLISKGFYLDYFLPASSHYINPNIPEKPIQNIIGGEVAIWSELLDENNFESRVWPRSAAVAERLWSPANVTNIDNMYQRLFAINNELETNGLNQKLNVRRMLSDLNNGQSIDAPMKVLETLAPVGGFARLISHFMSPENTLYQQVPLVNLADLIQCDSEQAWGFKKNVEAYLTNNSPENRIKIENKLKDWKNACNEMPTLITNAPNLKELEKYSNRVSKAINLGLKHLGSNINDNENVNDVKALNNLKQQGDLLEIKILPEIEGIIMGKMK